MRRLLLWNALAIFAVIVATLGVLSTGWDEDKFSENIGQMVYAAGLSVQQRYAGTPIAQIRAELEQLPPAPYPVRLIDAVEAQRLVPGFEPASREIKFKMRQEDEFVLIGIEQPEGALIIGPIPYKWPWSASYNVPVMALVSTAALGASLMLVLPLVRRLRRLRRATDLIESGDLSARVAESPVRDELDVVARHFNAMADRVQEYVRRQEMLLHAVSHETRAPISRLRFALELMRSEIGSEDGTRYLSECNDALADIQLVVDEVMTYARFKAEPYLQRERAKAADLIEAALADAALSQDETPIEVEVDEGLLIDADQQLFRRVLSNLLRNAKQHGGGAVRVVAEREAGASRDTESEAAQPALVRVIVSDDGPGVPESERERIFEPFARVDLARGRDTGGVGLGLAIVEAIVRAHGGTVHIEQAEMGGAAFVTEWPAEDAAGAA